ncbi:MAG: asparagine synthase (glutamine-hydrolyzing) [Myxococcales bacterium]|nr:asparagine synthase (glutamine-hydrolyzing) [Myxococcales bacterium]
MCGIAGVINLRDGLPPPTVEQLEAMAGALDHRGPDERGVYRDAWAGLAHTRLSIIDLSRGQQPLSNEDGSLWVVFNGEIFNYLELREELQATGHRFGTASDTEVVVHAFEEWGTQAFERFDGQFALALWDARERRAIFARDPFGIHPLHFAEQAGRLYFASEVKALFAGAPELPRELDPRGLIETFTFWSIVPPQSVFRGVHELRPGTVRIVEASGTRDAWHFAARYPRGEEGRFRGSFDDAVAATREALEQATRLRALRADVPVASYLSGGLDSSLVAALGQRARGGKLTTFSMRFGDAEYDETDFQRLMVRRLESDHHEVVIARRDIAEVFPDVIRHTERPVLRTAPAPLFLLSRLVRESGIKVVLTGEGADEMFAGYDLFAEGKVRRFWGRQPTSTWRPRLLQRLYPYLARSPVAQRAMAEKFFGRDLARYREPGFAHGPRWHSTASVRRLLTPELRALDRRLDVVGALLADLPAPFASWTPLAQDQYLEIRTLLGGYLLSSQGDRMLMAHSVEGRFPFLDPAVARLADSLPDAYKLHVLDEKHVLKRLAGDLLPEAVAQRHKQPYRAPDALAFVAPEDGRVPAWLDGVLSETALREAGVFEPQAAQALWQKCRRRRDAAFSNADNMALTALLSTQLLHAELLRRPPAIAPRPLQTLVDRVLPP